MAQTIIVDTTPGFRMPTIFYSQGDIGRTFNIDLHSRFGDSLPASPTITIQATKPSGLGFSVASTSISNSVVTFTVTDTMTNESGRFPAEIKVVKDSVTLYTANFYIECEASAHPEGTTDGDLNNILPKYVSVTTTTLPAGSSATYSYDATTNTATFGIPKGADGSLASDVLAPTYSSSSTYAVGDYVYYNGDLYICNTEISTAESWTSGHWTQVTVSGELSDVKADLVNANDNLSNFGLYYNFVNGSLASGVLNTSVKYRVACDTIISFDRDIVLKVATGFKFGVQKFVNGAFSTDSGWQTSSYNIPKNTTFKIVIARTTENTSEIANVSLFVSQVTFDTVNKSLIADASQLAMLNKSVISLTNSNVIVGEFVYGASGGIGTSVGYNRTDYVELPDFKSANIKFYGTLNSNAGFAFFTNNKTYISGVSGATASANGYEQGTESRIVSIPYNAKYLIITISKDYYSSPSDFDIVIENFNDIITSGVTLTADDFYYGAFDGTVAHNAVPVTNFGNRVISKFIKAQKGDVVTGSSTYKLVVAEFDDNFVYKAESSPWVTSYVVQNDGFIRVQSNTGSKTEASANIIITSRAQKYNSVLDDKESALKYINEINKKTCFGAFSPLSIAGITSVGHPHFLTLGHRGSMIGVPENTIPAFIYARKCGLLAFETDVQFTSDNVPVMLHDSTIDRTSNGSGTLTSMTFDQVRQYDFGSWVSSDFTGTQIPTLEETFDIARKLGMFIQLEFKQPAGGFTSEQVNIIINLVKKYNMNQYMNWSGLSAEQRQTILAEFPTASIQVSYLGKITSAVIDEALSVKTSQNHVIISTDISANDDDSIQLAIDAGIPLQFAFVNTNALMRSAHPYASWVTTDGVNMNDFLYREALGLN